MIYSSDIFYFNQKDLDFHISNEDIEKIKKLKSYRSNVSGHYDVMLQWRLEDNLHIVKTVEELSRLFVAMQFISMIADIIKENIKSIKLKDYHISLLRRLYLDFDSFSDNCITMGFKRPFGNSNVLGDVREELYLKEKSYKNDDDYTKESEVLLEFIDFLEEFYKNGFNLRYKSFTIKYIPTNINEKNKDWDFLEGRQHWYLRNCRIHKSEIREEKLNKILK